MMLLDKMIEQDCIYMDCKEYKLAIKELKKAIKLMKDLNKRKGK